MKIRVGSLDDFAGGAFADACLAIPVFAGTPPRSPMLHPDDTAALARLVESGVFTGKAQETYYLPAPAAPFAGILAFGLGAPDDCGDETIRRAAGKACAALAANRVARVALDWTGAPMPSPHGFVEGLMLGQYRFDRYKARKADEPAPVAVESIETAVASNAVAAARAACERAALECRNVNWARDLANAPSNDMTPVVLAQEARVMAEQVDAGHRILDEQDMAALGMNALLGVARGSAHPPRMVLLEYRAPGATRTLAMVGKGVTFDTGGVSIKPAADMHEMKFDMCGAAAVFGAFRSVAELRPAVNLIGVAPVVENAVGSKAQKPGDIVRACNGMTIEVHNTDAEGRLILADALAHVAAEYQPDCIVDVATLTGAAIVALGHCAAGLMSNNDALADALLRAGDDTGERLWRLPLWDDYDTLIEGVHADLCNIGPPKQAGTIVGGCFLKRFVGDIPWAHLDIAGTAWGGKHVPYLDPKCATGYGARLLAEWALREAG